MKNILRHSITKVLASNPHTYECCLKYSFYLNPVAGISALRAKKLEKLELDAALNSDGITIA
jgi:hypothetical protein